MQLKKKERLYITELIDEPLLGYPNYYMLSYSMRKNEILHDAIIALHTYDFEHYSRPESYEADFRSV